MEMVVSTRHCGSIHVWKSDHNSKEQFIAITPKYLSSHKLHAYKITPGCKCFLWAIAFLLIRILRTRLG
jgi:hypothetical protein